MWQKQLYFFPLLDFYAIFEAQNVFENKYIGCGKHIALPNRILQFLEEKKKFYFAKHKMLSKECVSVDTIRSSRRTESSEDRNIYTLM